MITRTRILHLAWVLAALLFVPACGIRATPDPTPTPTPLPGGLLATPTPEPTETLKPAATTVADELASRPTPLPTATPGLISQGLADLTAETGLDQTYLLGLSTSEWFDLGISVLIVLAGFALGSLLIRRVLRAFVRRTATGLDDRALDELGADLRWLVVLGALNFATQRLVWVRADLKDTLGNIYLIVALVLVAYGGWKLIDLLAAWYRERAKQEERESQLEPVISMFARLARVLLLLVVGTILLGNFGLNVTAFAAILALIGLAISLAAQNTIADAIAGLIILGDRPFRVGDRIEIREEKTWGDVVEIGLRTTRIRTRDNRLVIVPNSRISGGQVVNYSYPDPHYRIRTEVKLAYGTDLDRAEEVIVEAVRRVEGVMPGEPVDVLYTEMGDSAMVVHVRWWIESYVDTRRMLDRVHRSLQKALDAAGIEMPYPTQNVNLVGGSG